MTSLKWLSVLLLLVLLTKIRGQNSRLYDTSDWVPITKSCPTCYEEEEEEQPVVHRKPTGRVLNLADSPNQQKNFFPQEEQVKRQKEPVRQYLRETTQETEERQRPLPETYHPSTQDVQEERSPERLPYPRKEERPSPPNDQRGGYILLPQQQQVEAPVNQQLLLQQQQLLAAQLLNDHYRNQEQLRPSKPKQQSQYQPEEAQRYRPLLDNLYPKPKQNIEPVAATVSSPRLISIASTTPREKDEKEVVQLLYVPMENLQYKPRPQQEDGGLRYQPQIPQRTAESHENQYPARARSDPNEHNQQQLQKRIQNDFIRQAIEAQKLQAQLQQGDLPVAYTTTTTLRPLHRKRKPHQPPLALFMGADHKVQVTDVLNELKNAESIAVQDNVGPNTPRVFVGPSTLDVPDHYAKFDLPYLSNIENNRIQRKVDNLPFFVAPLSYKAPVGYSKIPLPSPHVGSVVVSTKEPANTISSTLKPTTVYARPTEDTNSYLYQYVPQHTSPKPVPQEVTEYKYDYSTRDLYQQPEQTDNLFENQASRRQPVSLTIRNRQPTTTTEQPHVEEAPQRRPQTNYYKENVNDEIPTRTKQQPGRYDHSNYYEEPSERPLQYRTSQPTQPRRQPTTPDPIYHQEEAPHTRQPNKPVNPEPAYQNIASIPEQPLRPKTIEQSHVDYAIRQPARQQNVQAQPSQQKYLPTRPPSEERETHNSRREPVKQKVVQEEEVSTVRHKPLKTNYYEETSTSEPSVFSYKPDEPRLGYEEEMLSSRGPLIIPNFYRKPSYEQYIPSYFHDDDDDDEYHRDTIIPTKRPSKINKEKPVEVTSPAYKPTEYETTTHKQQLYVRTTTTPVYVQHEARPKEIEDTRTTYNYYTPTTEHVSTVTHNNLEQPKYTTLEQFSVNHKSSTPSYRETTDDDKTYNNKGLSAYRTSSENSLRNNEGYRKPTHIDTEDTRPDTSSKTIAHEDARQPNPKPSNNYNEQTNDQSEDEDEHYNIPAQLPPINPILPGLINNLQDESVRPLLVPGLLVPTTEPQVTNREHYREKELTPVAITTTTQAPIIETTTHYRRGVRNRQRVSTRYTTPPSVNEAPAEITTRRSNQRGRRPYSRTRQESQRHSTESEEVASTTEFSPVRSNDYTTESPRRHITHSPRQRFRTRSRPVHAEEPQEPPKQVAEDRYPALQAPPRSYPQYEPAEGGSPKAPQRHHDVATTTENAIKEHTTHEVITETPKKNWLDDFSYSASVESAQALRNNNQLQQDVTTQRPTTRSRSRVRSRPRHSSTPPPTTTTRTTISRKATTTERPKEKAEEEEFYGFIRPPSYNKPQKPVQLHFDYTTQSSSLPKEYAQQYSTPRPEYIPKSTTLPAFQIDYTPKAVPDLSYYAPVLVTSTQPPKVQYYELAGEADKSGIRIYSNGDYVSTTPKQLFVPQYTVDQQHLAATPEPIQHIQQTTLSEEPTTRTKSRVRVPQRKRPTENVNSAENYEYDRNGEETQTRRSDIPTTKHVELPISSTDSYRYNNEVSDSYGQPITRRSNIQRTKTRGSVHFQPPTNLRQQADEDAIEGANYPSAYLINKAVTTSSPSFQITVDPDEAAESAYDQLPYSSIQRPSIVSPDNVVEAFENIITVTEEAITDENHLESTTEAVAIEENNTEADEIEEAQQTDDAIVADEATTTTVPTTTTPTPRKKQRRKGVWKLIKQRPIDHFEAAESQNYPIAIANGIPTFDKGSGFFPAFLKPDPTTTTTTTTESTLLNALYQMLGMSQAQINSTIDKPEVTTITPDAEVPTSTTEQPQPYDETTTINLIQQTAEEQQQFEGTTTQLPVQQTTLESLETTTSVVSTVVPTVVPTEAPTTEKIATTTPKVEQKHYLVGPWEMRAVKTLTSTEVSHQTEICYKGRCVKSSSSVAPPS